MSIKLKNVSKSFELSDSSYQVVLRNVTLNFPDKGLFFILGKSGSGKTTLLHVLESFLDVDSGDVNLLDYDLNSKKEVNKYRRDKIGVLYQNINLISGLTVKENLLLTADLKENYSYDVDKALTDFNLLDLKDRCVDDLSGGEKQRIALLRAIINNPKILFCDEPTGAIDPSNARIIMNKLRNISKEKLVIIVTHNLDLIKEGDNVIKIKDGEIIEKPEEDFIVDEKPANSEKNPAKSKLFSKKHEKSPQLFNKILTNRLFKKSTLKNVLFIISLFIGVLSLSLTAGLYFGVDSIGYDLVKTFQNYNVFQVSEVENHKINGSTIEASEKFRPEIDVVNNNFMDFETIEVNYSLDYFLLGKSIVKIDDKIIDFATIEFYYEDNLADIYVNDLFFEKYLNIYNGVPLYKTINIRLNRDYSYKGKNNLDEYLEVKDEFNFDENYYITKVVKEFRYLNSPKIYLPYYSFLNYLKNTSPNEINRTFIKNYTWFDLVKIAQNNEDLSNYALTIKVDDQEVDKMYKLIESIDGKTLEITNSGLVISESFIGLTDVLIIGLLMFSIISLIMTFCLLLFIIISLYLSEKKTLAILRGLGAKEKDLRGIFLSNIFVSTLISLLFSIIFNIFSSEIINKFINFNLNINKLIPTMFIGNINYGLTILVLAISIILLIYFFVFIVLKRRKLTNISEELREE